MIPAFLLFAALQDPGAAPQPAERAWLVVDRPMMIVNQDIITSSRLERDLREYARTNAITTDTEKRNAEMQLLLERVKRRLRVQAGANLGVDEKLIDLRVAESLERLRDREGGVVGLARFLESRGVSGPDVKQLLRDDIYEQLWTAGQSGEAAGPLGRVIADRYVRPGALRLQYQQALRDPSELQALGGRAGTVRFQQVVLDPEAAGGLEKARELARAVGQRLRSGEDLASILRDLGGAPEGDGSTEVEEGRLRELFPSIAAFTSNAAADQVSDPIETVAGGRTLVRVVRFLSRTEPVLPSFADAEVQRKLREAAVERVEEYRLDRGYTVLLRGSYVWPPEIVGRSN